MQKIMRKHLINCALSTFFSLIAVTSLQAQSGAYYSAITNLYPIVYLPLTETAQPPATPTATNYGTLGAADNGTYSQGAYPGAPGAIVADSDKACYLSADNNFMSAPYDPAYADATNFTVEFWFNSANEDPGEDSIINVIDAASPRHGWQIYTDGNEVGSFNFRTYYGNGTALAINYNIVVPGGHILPNTWYYVVVTYNGATATAQGYVNGVAVANNAVSAVSPTFLPSEAGPLFIGCRSDISFPFYPGAMDEVALYTNVLSASVISNHYTLATNTVAGAYYSAVLSAQPALYYRLDEVLPLATNYGTAGAVADAFYQSGTLPGVAGPTYTGFGPSGSLSVQFPAGESSYNGSTVMDPGASLLPIGRTANSPITVSAWVNVPSVPAGFSTVLGKGDTSYRFDVDTAGYPHWNAGAFGDITSTATLIDGNWHFWAGTWDGSSTMNFYIDGALVGESTGDTANTFNTNVLDLGAAPDYTGRNFEGGSLCQVAIFTNALTQNQITSLYFDSGITGIPPIITSQPNDIVVDLGSNVTLTVSALGFQPLSYQWYSNSVAVGANSSSFTITNATTNADGTYYVVVTDSESTPEMTTSSNAQIEVVSALPGTYFAAVAALGPIGYWPLNETNQPSTSTSTPETSEPIATNYGILGSADNGYYLPGTYPGSVPGPSVTGFPGMGTNNLAVAFASSNWQGTSNPGFAGFVDVPMDVNDSLNITGTVTLAAWLQAKPNDGRFETPVGRGDTSYRIDVDGTSSDLLHFNAVGGDLDGVAPAAQINDGKWHFVVGTYNGTEEVLYIDGVVNATAAETGLASGNFNDFTIGEAPDYGASRAFDGNIAQVAIFNYALSPGQVQSLFYAAGIATYIETEPPASITVPLGMTTNISIVANGTPTLTYKWSTNNGRTLLSGPEFSGTTTSSLTITSPSLQDSGTYVVVVSNAFGSVTSTPTVFTATDLPVLTPLAATNYVLLGTTLALSVAEVGPTPITNAWYFNGAKLSDGTLASGAIVSGSTTTSLTISNIQLANGGAYTMYASNAFGTSSTTGQVVVDLEPMLRDTGSYSLVAGTYSLGTSQFKPVISNGVLQIASDTPATSIDANAFWFNQKYYVGAFQVSFTFKDVDNAVGGACFVIQNASKGTNACGDAGTALGVAEWAEFTDSITNSFEFEIDVWNDAFAFDTNGVAAEFTYDNLPDPTTGSTNASPEFLLGDFATATHGSTLFDFTLTYLGTNLTVTYSNETTASTGSFETNFPPDFIPSVVGGSNTAYIGFTAGTQVLSEFPMSGLTYYYTFTGGYPDAFYFSKFTYTPIIALSITKTNNGGVVLNWPTGVGGYMLQETTNLASTNWTTLPVPYATNTSQMYQYIAAPATGTEFYRLVLP